MLKAGPQGAVVGHMDQKTPADSRPLSEEGATILFRGFVDLLDLIHAR